MNIVCCLTLRPVSLCSFSWPEYMRMVDSTLTTFCLTMFRECKLFDFFCQLHENQCKGEINIEIYLSSDNK